MPVKRKTVAMVLDDDTTQKDIKKMDMDRRTLLRTKTKTYLNDKGDESDTMFTLLILPQGNRKYKVFQLWATVRGRFFSKNKITIREHDWPLIRSFLFAVIKKIDIEVGYARKT